MTKIQQKKDGTEVLHTSLRNKYTFDYLIDGSGALGHVARLREEMRKLIAQATKFPPLMLKLPEIFQRLSMYSLGQWLLWVMLGLYLKDRILLMLD